MIDRREKILSPDEVQKILSKHFGFPEEHTSLWFEGASGPDKYILRCDRDAAGIDGDPPLKYDGIPPPVSEVLFDDRGIQAGVQP